MESNNKGNDSKVMALLKKYIFKNWGLKIVALLFAMVLWGVVLSTTNPLRTKTITGVDVVFTNISDLQAKDLMVRGDPLGEVNPISVRVNVPITMYAEVDAEYVSAKIDLSTVQSAGTRDLTITVSSVKGLDGGNVDIAIPEKVTVEISRRKTKKVPLRVEYSGELPEGYWQSDPVITMDGAEVNQIEIAGPEQDVDAVTKAVMLVDRNRKTDFDENVKIYYMRDSETKVGETGSPVAEEMDMSYFEGDIPEAHVSFKVKAKKLVTIDVEGSINGELPVNYEIGEYSSTPAALEIVGDKERLDEIEQLLLKNLIVTDTKTDIIGPYEVIVPAGVQLLDENLKLIDDSKFVDVVVEVREKVVERTFESMPINTEGLGRNLKATLSRDTTDIIITGKKGIVELLDRSDIKVYVDLEGRTTGEVDIDVIVYIQDDETTLELRDGTESSVKQIRVTLSEK
ncbi:hypothetical protein LJC27_05950 [Christensenellaceae bacterium OttesenSCG-928-M15]|nr:hypothetical protein [Christensenellaceae bacterium OttesenSCG-928-M15]